MMEPIKITPERAKELGYGIFNGQLMGLHYNREQKRRYLKEHKRDRHSSHCNWCNGKTATITDDYGDSVCELCGIVKKEAVRTVEIKPESYTTECTSGYCQVLEGKENEQYGI